MGFIFFTRTKCLFLLLDQLCQICFCNLSIYLTQWGQSLDIFNFSSKFIAVFQLSKKWQSFRFLAEIFLSLQIFYDFYLINIKRTELQDDNGFITNNIHGYWKNFYEKYSGFNFLSFSSTRIAFH